MLKVNLWVNDVIEENNGKKWLIDLGFDHTTKEEDYERIANITKDQIRKRLSKQGIVATATQSEAAYLETIIGERITANISYKKYKFPTKDGVQYRNRPTQSETDQSTWDNFISGYTFQISVIRGSK